MLRVISRKSRYVCGFFCVVWLNFIGDPLDDKASNLQSNQA